MSKFTLLVFKKVNYNLKRMATEFPNAQSVKPK